MDVTVAVDSTLNTAKLNKSHWVNVELKQGNLFGLFDPGSGYRAAQVAAEAVPAFFSYLKEYHTIKDSFIASFDIVDKTVRLCGDKSSTSAALVYVSGKTLFTANLGTSNIVLCRNDLAIQLTHTYKRSETVRYGIGLYPADGNRVSYVPVFTTTLMNGEDRFVIIANENVWKVCSATKAVEIAKKEATAQDMATQLVKHAMTLNPAEVAVSVGIFVFQQNKHNKLNI